MKSVKYTIHYCGYIGCEYQYEVMVDDDVTQDEIERAVEEDYEEKVLENCYFEIDEEVEEDA